MKERVQGTPILETKRFILRPLSTQDVIDIFKIFSHPEVMEYSGGVLFTTRRQAEEYIDYTMHDRYQYTWAFIDKESGDFVGTGGIRNLFNSESAEVGLVLGKPFWHKQVGPEIMEKVIQFCFDILKLAYVYAAILPDNLRALRLVEKLGFSYRGTYEHYWLNNQFVKVLVFLKRNNRVPGAFSPSMNRSNKGHPFQTE